MNPDVPRQLPAMSQVARRTPTFDQQSVPPALLKQHHTTVWAELVVLRGRVIFQEIDPLWQTNVDAGERAVIVPERRHQIEPDSNAQFYVQFYDPPDGPAGRDDRDESDGESPARR